jgi:choline dehydrogenase
MRRYFTHFENNTYLPRGTPGHGFEGWLSTSTPNLDRVFRGQEVRVSIFRQLPFSLGYDEGELLDRMRTDANSADPNCDSQQDLFNFPFHHTPLGNRTNRTNPNLLLAATLAERADDGSSANPLTIQLDSLVTKVLFDTDGDGPRATGVEYMRGKSLYRADPCASWQPESPPPETHHVFARKSVILSGGVFNTPQILKLSGIGPAAELRSHAIPVVVDLPGVRARLQDDYEISLAAYASVSLVQEPQPGAPERTFGRGDDPASTFGSRARGHTQSRVRRTRFTTRVA